MRKVISGRRGTSRSAGSCVIRIIIPSQILWLLLKLLVNERRSKFETRSKWLRIRSRFATIFARSCRAWLTSQSIGSPSSRPPLGLQEINRRDLDKIWRVHLPWVAQTDTVRQAKTDAAPSFAAGSSWKSSFGQEQALAKTTPASVKNTRRYRPEDKLLAFLKGL